MENQIDFGGEVEIVKNLMMEATYRFETNLDAVLNKDDKPASENALAWISRNYDALNGILSAALYIISDVNKEIEAQY